MVLSSNYPSFSVLMSVYKNDDPDYFDFALESIERQSVKPSEIVLVEDGLISDALHRIVEKHAKLFEGNLKIIKLKKNNGLGNALKIGIKSVSNQWVARMDSDDYSVPDRFEKQLNKIMAEPEIAIVGGQVKEFNSNIENIVGSRTVPIGYKEICSFLKWRSPFNHPTVMFNKRKIEKAGGYIPYGNLEDYYLWSRVIAKGYIVKNLSDTLTYMRVDKGIYSRRGRLSNIKYFYSLRNFLRRKKIINSYEEIVGDIIVTVNIILPSIVRKTIYQNILHKNQ
ncbi:glycosyltransferase [Limosilactobacillus vaginalis]|uniref:glycosyltransferase n=1 Tax=Limosilactobacillus vaginalis TaxID=1633 RepID=UPI0025A35BCA|nr:glycosyltransferase [Limosilactobacillus vaginalis]MDM8260094.1 glycosyltransferase [Limosilactobacillus vaginalis]